MRCVDLLVIVLCHLWVARLCVGCLLDLLYYLCWFGFDLHGFEI